MFYNSIPPLLVQSAVYIFCIILTHIVLWGKFKSNKSFRISDLIFFAALIFLVCSGMGVVLYPNLTQTLGIRLGVISGIAYFVLMNVIISRKNF